MATNGAMEYSLLLLGAMLIYYGLLSLQQPVMLGVSIVGFVVVLIGLWRLS